MKKLIQIRGANASGKTTAVRGLIEEGNFDVLFVEIQGKNYPYTYDGKIAIAGRYDKNECGGADACIHSAEALQEYIVKLLKDLGPEAFILDAVMYGTTFKFGYELSVVCKKLGYEYIGLCFTQPFEETLRRIYGRNGGREINAESLLDKQNSSLKSFSKLKAAGVNVRLIDTSKIPKDEMKGIIKGVL